MKPARLRLDVNLEELDRVLDGARQAPLTDSDHDKLKDALHAMAALLVRSRNTEKTSAVVEEAGSAPPPPVNPDEVPAAGHGRNSAAAFTGARKVAVPHQKLQHGGRCPECGQGNVYVRRSRRFWSGSWVRRRWRQRCTRWNGYGAERAGRYSRPRSRKEWERRSTTRRQRR